MSRNYPNGCVYAFESGELVKIGKSHDAEGRIKQVKGISGRVIERTYITPLCSNYDQIETDIKERFKEKRHLGEWFKVRFDEVVLEIEKANFVSPVKETKPNTSLFDSTCRQMAIEMLIKETKRAYPKIEDHLIDDEAEIAVGIADEQFYAKVRIHGHELDFGVYSAFRSYLPLSEIIEHQGELADCII
jgi:hypothetical protein